jgi:hypothetical protein
MHTYIVTWHGIETPHKSKPYAFSTEEKAREFIMKTAEKNHHTIKSCLNGSLDNCDEDDYRAEDNEGNSFYYVLYSVFIE